MDIEFSHEVASTSSYRVEVSGWDASDAFFVEKTMLDWSGGDEKQISLRVAMREGAVIFVRLLQQFGKVDNFPIAYQAASVRDDENGRTLVQLARLHPRRSPRDESDLTDESRFKVA
ncbi:MAG TPA: hypothetical protein VMB02_12115 [Candidatus Aquilonibacter sp.]|nr:hypothetical protein [Candidatus Aquilonibacter sp.]